MDSFVIAYIDSRMKQMGHTHYTIEPYLAVLPDGVTEYNLNCFNEVLFLNSKEVAHGTEMIADNNYFKVEDYYSYMELTKVQEFTGFLTINVPAANHLQVFEFIRVIPLT
jgi:hypothetical protein